MASTTNFNWSTPDDTSLVKDGAAAIRTLGQSIDTSMAELKGGTTGQVLSKTSNTDMDFTWVAQDDSNAIQNAIVDAKGDLIAATANDTPARLAVGTNGQVLTADSTVATGLAWATPSGTVQLATGTLSGSSVAITSIPSTYHTLILRVTAFRGSVDTKMAVRFNNDANARYNRTVNNFTDNDSFGSSYFNATGTQDSAVGNSILSMTVYNYANTSIWKMAETISLGNNGTTTTNFDFVKATAFYNQTTAISEINMIPEAGGNWSAGTYTLYGVR